MRDAAKHLSSTEAQVEAAIIIADAERAVVADTPRVGKKMSDSGVTHFDAEKKELSRMRQAHEGLDDGAYEALVQESRDTQTPLTRDKLSKASNQHLAEGTGNNERYTPSHIIEAARACMGGIDLDPASCAEANETVRAANYFDAEMDGLKRHWYGRVWLNPPYGRGEIDAFVARLLESDLEQAIVITHNATETRWCQALLAACNMACFPASRIDFRSGGEGGIVRP